MICLKKIGSAAISALLFFNMLFIQANADDYTVLVSSKEAYRGQVVSVAIGFSQETVLTGLQFKVTYNASIFEPLQKFNFTLNSNLVNPIYDILIDKPNEISFFCAIGKAVTAKDLAVLTFTVKANADSGRYPINVSNFKLTDDSEPLKLISLEPQNIQNGSITILGSTGGDNRPAPGGVGGGSGSVTPIATATPAATSTPVPQAIEKISKFTDIGEAQWAADSIKRLEEKGILDGYKDQEGRWVFKPQQEVTREQFVKMLMSAYGLGNDSDSSTFTDVKHGEWYDKYLASAQKLGIVKGQADGTFGVGANITRQEMALMAYRMTQYVNIKFTLVAPPINFKDSEDIAPYALDSIRLMQQAGILNGIGEGLFNPNGTATRAMAAQVLVKIISLQ